MHKYTIDKITNLEAEISTLELLLGKVKSWRTDYLDSCESGPIIHDGGIASLDALLNTEKGGE